MINDLKSLNFYVLLFMWFDFFFLVNGYSFLSEIRLFSVISYSLVPKPETVKLLVTFADSDQQDLIDIHRRINSDINT